MRVPTAIPLDGAERSEGADAADAADGDALKAHVGDVSDSVGMGEVGGEGPPLCEDPGINSDAACVFRERPTAPIVKAPTSSRQKIIAGLAANSRPIASSPSLEECVNHQGACAMRS